MWTLTLCTAALLAAGCWFTPSNAAMTEAQIKQASKMMRNVCQPKVGADTDKLDGLAKGQFPDDEKVKCYTKCIMGMMQSWKNGKFSPDAAIAQADKMLPDTLRDRVKAGLSKCRQSADGFEDPCEAAYAATKCQYNADPEIFFFP